MFSLPKIKEVGSSSQPKEEAGGSKSEVKEEVEYDPLLSAVPPPSELECKQEEGFVRPKLLPVKYIM